MPPRAWPTREGGRTGGRSPGARGGGMGLELSSYLCACASPAPEDVETSKSRIGLALIGISMSDVGSASPSAR